MANSVIISGKICHKKGEPDELKCDYTNERARLKFNVACKRNFMVDGSAKKSFHCIPCRAWDNYAKVIAKYFKRGEPILIHGVLTTSINNGHFNMYVTVEAFEFVTDTENYKKAVDDGLDIGAMANSMNYDGYEEENEKGENE